MLGFFGLLGKRCFSSSTTTATATAPSKSHLWRQREASRQTLDYLDRNSLGYANKKAQRKAVAIKFQQEEKDFKPVEIKVGLYLSFIRHSFLSFN